MNIIYREKYLEKVKPFIDKQIVKIFVGQRRTGKSYMLLQLSDFIKKENPDANIIFINKEEFEFDNIRNYQDLYTYVESKSKKNQNYIFIDEIQEIKEFQKAVRSLLHKGIYDIYCTGSNANLLSGDLATLLSGRYIEFNIHSLTYPEFLKFHQLENTDETLARYMKQGGLPFLIHLPSDDKIVLEYLKNIYNTIFFKDVISRYNIRNVSFLGDLTKFLSNNCGSLFSANSISKYLKSQNIKVSYDMIANYMEYLAHAFIIHRVKRANIEGKKIFETGEKVFFDDVGLRNAIGGYRQEDISKIMENVVYLHLITNGYNVSVGASKTAEIDFIAEKQNETKYIQVSYLLNDESTIEREFGNLIKIKDNYPKYVISLDKIQAPNTFKGIINMSLRDLLSMEDF